MTAEDASGPSGSGVRSDRAAMPEPPRELADCLRLLRLAEHDGQIQAEAAAALTGKAAERDRLAAALTAAQAERDAVLGSTFWRLTAPLRALVEGFRRARDPRGARPSAPSAEMPRYPGLVPSRHHHDRTPSSPCCSFPEHGPVAATRISLVLDRLRAEEDSERDAVAVRLALAIQRQRPGQLRILTRLEPAVPTALDRILRRYGLASIGNPSFASLAGDGEAAPAIGIGAGERAVAGGLANAWIACTFFRPDRVIQVVDGSEVPAPSTPRRGDNRARMPIRGGAPTWVFTNPDAREALRRAGLLSASPEARASRAMWTLPQPAWTPDWHRSIDRFVRDWLSV